MDRQWRKMTRLVLVLGAAVCWGVCGLAQPKGVWLQVQRFPNKGDPCELEELCRFYKQHGGRDGGRLPRILPGHVQYTLRCRQNYETNAGMATANNNMIATLRLCPRQDDESPWLFLRGLLVATPWRRQGWALQLLRQTLAQESSPVFLLAEPALAGLYHKAGFVPIDDLDKARHDNSLVRDVPDALRQRYASINRRLASRGKRVLCFGYIGAPLLHVLILQHAKEVNRPTGTAGLVYPSQCKSPPLWQVSKITWSGRADNDQVENHLQYLLNKGHCLVLLWPGGASKVQSFGDNGASATKTTFVLLDGTWQEAQAMFRKIPFLVTLPRLSLIPRGGPSQYRLRGDYGWKQRFAGPLGSDLEDSCLCTVETVAELLEQSGQVKEGNLLRFRLEELSRSLGDDRNQ